MPSPGRGWGYTIEQLEKWWAEGRIARKRDGTPRMDGLIVFLDKAKGQLPQSIWTDVQRVANTSKERLGYPTQKPEALLAGWPALLTRPEMPRADVAGSVAPALE